MLTKPNACVFIKDEEHLEEIESKREEALKKVDAAYYDRQSPHFKDNERYSWAVKTINESFDKDIEDYHNRTI